MKDKHLWDIPESWVWTSVKKIHNKIGTIKKKNIIPKRFPRTKFELYSVPSYDANKPEILFGEEIGSNKKIVEPDAILLCKINPRINRVWIVGNYSDFEKISSTEWIIYFKNDEIYPKYLQFYFQTPGYRSYLSNNVSGVGGSLMRVNQNTADDYAIPIAPYNEQVRIVDRVEELFSRLDAGVRSLQATQTQLEQYRQTTLKQAYTGKLTQKWRQKLYSKDTSEIPNSPSKVYWNIPSSWEWKRLEMIAEINPKLPINEISDTLEVTFIPMASVEEETGKIVLSEIKQYGQVKKGYTKFYDGDIIFAKITPCMENGKVAIVKGLSNKIGIGSTEFHVIRLDSTLVKEFYFYYLLQKWFRSLAIQHFTGTVGHRRVPTDFIKKAYVPVPPIEEQKEVVSKLDEMNTIFYHVHDSIRKTLKNTYNLKNAVLKKAFEGRLISQDPNDEPASLLLERIKAQKVKQGKLM